MFCDPGLEKISSAIATSLTEFLNLGSGLPGFRVAKVVPVVLRLRKGRTNLHGVNARWAERSPKLYWLQRGLTKSSQSWNDSKCA
jgi:hypothetical protein